MQKAFGTAMARRINQRLEEFGSVANLGILRRFPGVNCHELTGTMAGCLAVNVSPNYRMVFKPAHEPPPEKVDGGLDWDAVTEILILSIEDYH